jgi:hypothetical protein
MHKSLTYRLFIRFSAVLILFGVLLPVGLQAKSLVEYCLTSVELTSEMLPDHSCCESHENEPDNNTSAHHQNHCDWGVICACNISLSTLSDHLWIVKVQDAAIKLDEHSYSALFISVNEPIDHTLQIKVGEHNPPLWLEYDTLLL